MTRKYTSIPYTEYTVANGHFDKSRAPIDRIILHSSASTKQGLINTFGGGTRMVSAHYGIDNDGNLMAFLEEYWTAYHCGNYAMNQRSIGIEHVDEGADKKIHSDKQYEMSIRLIADICKYYDIKPSTTTILPHSQITATACPNGLDVNRIISGVQNKMGKTDELEACLTAHKQAMDAIFEKDKQIASQKTMIENLQGELKSCNALRNQGISALEIAEKTIKEQEKEIKKLEEAVDARVKEVEELSLEVSRLNEELLKAREERDTALEEAKKEYETTHIRLAESKWGQVIQRFIIDFDTYWNERQSHK